MKFLCSNCKAKYQIPDDKVAGRTLRMTCRRCKEEIVIRGEPVRPSAAGINSPLPVLSAPPSALAADFHSRVSNPSASFGDTPMFDEWHVAINEIPVGPMRRDEVARKIATGAVGPDSLAWREGLDDWIRVAYIPELAMLLPAGMRPSSLPPAAPVAPMQPAQRAEAMPLGGRAGAAAFHIEEWPTTTDTSPSQVAMNPLLEGVPGVGRSGASPSPSLIFALLGFTFLMFVMAVVAVRWLMSDPRQVAAVQPAPTAPVSAPTAPAEPAEVEPEEEDVGEMVIELEPEAAPKKQKGPSEGNKTASNSSTSKGKQLTAAQKAMLERMGGGGVDPTKLSRSGATSSGSSRGKGELTAAQLSKVVRDGKQNLQRCYETAMRSSGSDDTIRMDVSVTIAESGNVKKVNAKGQGLPGMDNCIERTVKMWRFPASGGETQTQFPLVFSPGG